MRSRRSTFVIGSNYVSFCERGGTHTIPPLQGLLTQGALIQTCRLFRQKLFAEGFALHAFESLDDLELASRQRLADEDVVNQVMVLLHGDFARGAFELLDDERIANLVHFERVRLLD